MSFPITEPPVAAEINALASASSETLAAAAPDKADKAAVNHSPHARQADLPPRDDNLTFSRAPTMVAHPTPALPSNLRRYTLLALFSAAQFFDIYLSSASIVAIKTISDDLGMSAAESTWLVNAYSLTLAAFLLAAGRVADIYSAKWTFVGGFAWVGLFCLGIGFSPDKITILVLRAFCGIGASATIPSALHLIVMLFPVEKEQARAIAIFGGTGAIANVLGLVLGAVLLLASWHWIFWLVTIITVPGAIVAALLIPSASHGASHDRDVEEKPADALASQQSPVKRQPKMDYLGLLFLTAAIVLLIFGMGEGSAEGWNRARAIAPLVIGVLLFPAFFWWETRMDPVDALINPSIWHVKNFALIVLLSLVPYFWWYINQVVFSDLFQGPWNTSAILTSAYFLPNGIAGGAVIVLSGYIPDRITLKWRIIGGSLGATAGALLLCFASAKHWYWPLIFPGLIIGSSSMAVVYVSSNVALILSVPAHYSGVAGGTFNASLQLGASVGLAIATAIQVSFPTSPGSTTPSWKGYQSSLFFSVALTLAMALLTLVFFRDPVADPIEGSSGQELAAETENQGVPPAQT